MMNGYWTHRSSETFEDCINAGLFKNFSRSNLTIFIMNTAICCTYAEGEIFLWNIFQSIREKQCKQRKNASDKIFVSIYASKQRTNRTDFSIYFSICKLWVFVMHGCWSFGRYFKKPWSPYKSWKSTLFSWLKRGRSFEKL